MEIANDEYWLKYGKTSIEQALSSRNEAAAKLEKMTLWFWGLYTASFTIGVSTKSIEAPVFVLVLLASPIVLLILTYWFCILAQLPVHAEFNPTIPYEIKQAYNAGLRVKNNRFVIARVFTLLSATLLSIALFSLSFVDKKRVTAFEAEYHAADSILRVSGIFPQVLLVQTTIDSLTKKDTRVTFYTNQFRIQENGILNVNVPLRRMPSKAIITVSWTDKKESVGMTRVLSK